MSENENLRPEEENSSKENTAVTEPEVKDNVNITPTPNPTNVLSIASLILGVLSCMTCCIGFHPFLTTVPIGSGIMAIIFSVASRKEGKQDGIAKAGLICGIVGIVLACIIILFWVIVFFIAIIDGFASSGELM